jgi:hypothetical protein
LNLPIVVRVHAPEPTLRSKSPANHMPENTADSPANSALDDAFLSVWRQSLVEKKKVIALGGETYSVRRTAKSKLAQIDFEVDGTDYRGLEQNPQTTSRWAKMARDGAKVMQFLQAGVYLAVVADGQLKHYGPKRKT